MTVVVTAIKWKSVDFENGFSDYSSHSFETHPTLFSCKTHNRIDQAWPGEGQFITGDRHISSVFIEVMHGMCVRTKWHKTQKGWAVILGSEMRMRLLKVTDS